MIDISSLAERMIERNKNSNNLNLNQTKINQSDTLNKNNFIFICYWKRRLRPSLENSIQKNKNQICTQRDVQTKNN